VSTQDDVRGAIVTLVKGVTNTGKVYDHYKYSSDWNLFLDQFAFVDALGRKHPVWGWWLSIPSVVSGHFSTFDEPTDTYTWPLRAVGGVADKWGAEVDFENMIYGVRNALKFSLTLGLGSDRIVPGSIVCDIPTADMRQFGSVLCHYAELTLRTEVQVPAPVYTP